MESKRGNSSEVKRYVEVYSIQIGRINVLFKTCVATIFSPLISYSVIRVILELNYRIFYIRERGLDKRIAADFSAALI